MKQWMDEKRLGYLERILRLKATKGSGSGSGSGVVSCSCGNGRAIWRCGDCADKSAICLFCCRNRHKLNWFHRVEKWNGRFYQRGALWQVGVKIYVGHGGNPCPKSVAALSQCDLSPSETDHGPIQVDIDEVALQFGKSREQLLTMVSSMLEGPLGAMSDVERQLLDELCRRTGETPFHLLRRLKASVARNMEQEAETLQASSDQVAAETETMEEVPSTIPIVDDATGDDDWEDEDDSLKREHVPRFLPRPPPSDGAGNQFVTVVHDNGFHSLPVVWCNCSAEGLESRDLQLLDLHLYPASYDNIKTVFSFACLDDHRYNYLECKSSHYQYHNKLRRLTCPEYPDAAPNRYAELCRVSRQWRNLKYRKWFWQFQSKVGRGQMAIFCAACPQPDVNLPDDWKEDYDRNP